MKILTTLLFRLGLLVFAFGLLIFGFLLWYPLDGIGQAINAARYLHEITLIGLFCVALAGIVRIGSWISGRF